MNDRTGTEMYPSKVAIILPCGAQENNCMFLLRGVGTRSVWDAGRKKHKTEVIKITFWVVWSII